MSEVIKTIWVALVFSLFCTFPTLASEKVWTWTLDTIHYSLHFGERELNFSSDMSRSRIKIDNCSAKFIIQFRQIFQRKLASYLERERLPKDYPPIEIYSPDFGRFDVARGTELGLFLIDMKLRVAQLESRAKSVCKL
jgi:hypothetical protein